MFQANPRWESVIEELGNEGVEASSNYIALHFAGGGLVNKWHYLFTKRIGELGLTSLTLAHGLGSLESHIVAFDKLCAVIVKKIVGSEPNLKYRIGDLLTSYEWVQDPEKRFQEISREYFGMVQRL